MALEDQSKGRLTLWDLQFSGLDVITLCAFEPSYSSIRIIVDARHGALFCLVEQHQRGKNNPITYKIEVTDST